MPHGGPDWGLAAPSSYVFPIVSWEEYFMRSGLVKTLDGKGDIIFYDSFENGISKWYQSAGITAVELSLDHARGGNWSLKIPPGSEAAATIPVDEPNRFGAEFNFIYNTNFYSPIFHLYYSDFAREYHFGVLYDSVNNKLEYYAPFGVWTEFADVTLERLPMYYFHPCKLVIDANKLEYVKFIFRGIEYDLTGKETAFDIWPSRRAVQPHVWWNQLGGPAVPTYIDDIIVTTNEP